MEKELYGLARRKHAMIAMSGGVDSSVAALLMQEAGYDCLGVTMRLYRAPGFQTRCAKSCCSDEDEDDAAIVCDQLGIEHESLCCTKRFAQTVIRRFVQEYEAGRTPNPCIDCNRYLKFDTLMEQMRGRGFDVLVTGHYVRSRYSEADGRWQLMKAADARKDQSYVLYMLTQEQLSRLCFPLGTLRKEEARQIAQSRGLTTAKKADSQDICFVPDGDHAAFIERWSGKRAPEGDIVDLSGRVLGRHRGLIRYTVGQRRGLNVSLGESAYVVEKNLLDNTLRVGPQEALNRRELTASDFHWLSIPEPARAMRCTARTRYHQPEADAAVFPLPGRRARIVFDEPQRAVTPGQAVVLYDGELVLGGGTIEA